MAVESKPLFHPEFLRQQVRSFNLPEQTGAWQPTLQHWAGLIPSRRADDFKETALLPELLTDISCGLLGYTGPVGPADTHNSHNSPNSHLSGTGPAAPANTFTFSREHHVEVDGKPPLRILLHPRNASTSERAKNQFPINKGSPLKQTSAEKGEHCGWVV